jgi:hypothetical protein
MVVLVVACHFHMNMATFSGDLLLCCCAGCIRGDDDSTAYYSALNLSPSASHEEIRKSWRSFSLRFHPDKLAQRGKEVTDEDQKMFARAKDAYNVLSDPVRRRVYDSYGANGVKWSDDPSSIDPHMIYRNFTHATVRDRARVVVVFALLITSILSFPIFLCIKLDGANLPWLLVAFPLLLLESVWLVVQLVGLAAIRKAMATSRKKNRHHQSPQRHGGESTDPGADRSPHLTRPSKDATMEDDPESGKESDDDDEEDVDDDESGRGDPWERKVAFDMATVGAVGTALALVWQSLIVVRLQVRGSFSLSFHTL